MCDVYLPWGPSYLAFFTVKDRQKSKSYYQRTNEPIKQNKMSWNKHNETTFWCLSVQNSFRQKRLLHLVFWQSNFPLWECKCLIHIQCIFRNRRACALLLSRSLFIQRGFLKVFHLSALWWRVFPCIIDARCSTWHAVQRSINMQTHSEPPYNPTQSSSSLLFLWTAIKTGSECVIKPRLYTHTLTAGPP